MASIKGVFGRLWSRVKALTNQTDTPGKEGTALGRLLVSSVPHPIVQLAVPIVDPLFANLWDRVVDTDKKTPTELELQQAIKSALINHEAELEKHYTGMLNYVFKEIDLPLIDGVAEDFIESEAKKAIKSFIKWQVNKLAD